MQLQLLLQQQRLQLQLLRLQLQLLQLQLQPHLPQLRAHQQQQEYAQVYLAHRVDRIRYGRIHYGEKNCKFLTHLMLLCRIFSSWILLACWHNWCYL